MSHCTNTSLDKESAGFSSAEQSLFLAIFLFLAIALLGYVQYQLADYVGGGVEAQPTAQEQSSAAEQPSKSKQLLDAFESKRRTKQ